MNTADDFFMNHAFVSELWLFNALKQNWSHKEEWRKQMLDEKKHCAMTRGALKKNVSTIDYNLDASVEKAMYEGIGKIDVDNITDEDEFSALAYVVERRAILLYKRYLKYGSNDYYKKILSKIIADEEDHKDTHTNDNPYMKKYKVLDSKIWKAIRAAYPDGDHYYDNIQFWKDVFTGQLKNKCSISTL